MVDFKLDIAEESIQVYLSIMEEVECCRYITDKVESFHVAPVLNRLKWKYMYRDFTVYGYLIKFIRTAEVTHYQRLA